MTAAENLALLLSLIGIILALIVTFIAFIQRQQRILNAQKSGGKKIDEKPSQKLNMLDIVATFFVWFTFAAVTITIAIRAVESGHGPFSSMYEFAVAFAWGIILAGIIYQWRYKTGAIKNIGLMVALILIIFARVQFSQPAGLVPALQQSVLLSAHVASAVVAYGTLTIGFGAAMLLLIQNRAKSIWLPDVTTLDTVSYHAVLVGFPFLTLLIILGALWADIAWGKYWSWDPKETASLVTWLIYVGYMHARIIRGWRDNKSAALLIVGFLAIVFTFFGNYIFSGLHAY